MAVEIKFTGKYHFESAETVQQALKEVEVFLEEEGENVSMDWESAHSVSGATIQLKIHTQCTEDDYLNYEGIVEILADYAISGTIMGWRDDYEPGEVEPYPAEGMDDFI